MKVRIAFISMAWCLVHPCCLAAVNCADLDPSSPQFSNRLTSVGQAAGIAPARFTQDHRQAVLDLCAGREERVEDIIDQRRVSAREIGAIRRVLVIGNSKETHAAAAAARPNAGADAEPIGRAVRKPGADEAAGIDRAVDQLFIRWSRTWFTDRYILASAHVSELMTRGPDYLARGTFSFTRYGATATIPFAATLRRKGDFEVHNLCYNDTTSGMTDCTASGESSAASRLMGAVVLAGIVSGLSGSGASGDQQGDSGSAAPQCVTPGESSYGRLNCYGYPIDSSGVAHEYRDDN